MKHNLAQDLEQCALPAALEAMGERWSFLILRGALSGLRHFEEFQSTLGIARNILANRLSRLVENGIMVRQPMLCDRRKVEYRLTDKGQDLAPAMIALRQWGEKWGCGPQSCQVLADIRDRQPIRGVAIQAHDGRMLELSDLCWVCPDEMTPMTSETERQPAAA
ncbi:MAG: transcriptional regulator [Sphingobium sp.]|jgi:DNA-binding HxlR family transcriptional regulator|uniref:winged helix-turn-helix transcriptional regulator n=1 Tax=Sphingobium sp. TaxID=1912891 RepID=UPI000DB73A50|nr:helix-turn-helix domain-containing protein [Sphingobium sp.]PZU08959.1 MAG: transcriptional regulator [Sphingobium sp.]